MPARDSNAILAPPLLLHIYSDRDYKLNGNENCCGHYYQADGFDHSDKVAKYEKDLYTNFVTSRVAVIVADTDDATAGAKLAKVPMMQEHKRKLFLYQEDLNAKIDMDKVKKRKISKYAPIKPVLSDDSLDGPKEIYLRTRTTAQNGSETAQKGG